jgi:hypothetical protein
MKCELGVFVLGVALGAFGLLFFKALPAYVCGAPWF